jgi:hypothetical protein
LQQCFQLWSCHFIAFQDPVPSTTRPPIPEAISIYWLSA